MRNRRAGPRNSRAKRLDLARLNGCVDFCRPSPSQRLQTALSIRWLSAGSGSQAQISSAHRRYRQSAHPRPNFASRGILPPSQRAGTCASRETPSVQGRLSLLDRSPEGAALHGSLTRALIFVRGTSSVRFSASNAPTRNRARSTGGGIHRGCIPHISQNCARFMQSMSFSCAQLRMIQITTAD